MGKKLLSFFCLVLADVGAIFISFWLAYLIRNDFLPQIFPRFSTVNLLPFSTFTDYFYIAVVWVFIFAYEKLYTKRFPFWEEIKILLKSASLSFTFVMVMIFISRKQIRFSRTIVILAWLLSLVLFPFFRYFTKFFLVKFNLWKKKLIILGVHQTSLAIIKSIRQNTTMGYEVVGFLDNDPQKQNKIFLGVKVLGPIKDLERITKTYQFKDIMIATPHLPRNQLKELLAKSEQLSESMWLIPRSGDFITEGVEIEVIGQVLTLYIKKNLEKTWNILIKTFFDKVLTTMLTIVFLPILAGVAIAIKLDSPGPVIFTQKRIGRNRKFFNLFKFRSMYTNSDKKLTEYLETDEDARQEWKKYKKLKNHDPRVTKVGKIIRKYSLDELPQLINVLIGNMSLVGPRPYLAEELKGKDAFIDMIIRVKPGITGLWQISGRSELPFEERNALDEYYIRNWSLWLDITILLKSIKVLLSRKGAY
jgi:Undecaprenyl-phosphate galactose phosphotransferase WbaP